jgi:hypothetical protein
MAVEILRVDAEKARQAEPCGEGLGKGTPS